MARMRLSRVLKMAHQKDYLDLLMIPAGADSFKDIGRPGSAVHTVGQSCINAPQQAAACVQVCCSWW